MVSTHSARQFRNRIDREAIERTIARIHAETSGEIRVVISPFFWGNVRKHAERTFRRLGLASAAHRNAVLLFVVPRRRAFVILGDAGIHERVGPELWHGVRDGLAEAFRAGRYTEGIVTSIELVGAEIARHFPAQR